MSNFRTTLPFEKAAFQIDYQSPSLCIGSCFTQNIGQLLGEYKFPVLLNPFGILYNPISIKNSLELLLKEKEYVSGDLFLQRDLWHSFDHHGAFSHPDTQVALANINQRLGTARLFLQKTNRLLITFGTATIYIQKTTGKVVANCHKVPNTAFDKKRLSIKEIVDAYLPLLKKIKLLIPDVKIIFTVSPVRHIRDGFIENQRSKATLLLAIEALVKQFPNSHYFPAYELILDDLREYRFFGKDMVHPNEIAIQYIWNYFQKTYFLEATQSILKEVKKIVQASQHRSFHPQTAMHQQFVKKQLVNIDNMERKYTFLRFQQEKQWFEEQLV